MLFSEVIFKNLRRRWARTLLTVLGLAVAVTATTTLWNIAWGYADTAQEFYSDRGVDIVVVRAGVANRLTSSLKSELATRLKAVPGVEDVDGSLTEMVSVGKAILIGIPLRGLIPGGFTIAKLPIGQGRSLQPKDQGVVIIGNGIAATLNKRPGDSLDVEGKEFQVVGIIDAGNPFDANCIITPVGDVQALMGRPGTISEFQVRATKTVRDDAVCKASAGPLRRSGMISINRSDSRRSRLTSLSALPPSRSWAARRLGRLRRSLLCFRLQAFSIRC